MFWIIVGIALAACVIGFCFSMVEVLQKYMNEDRWK